MTCSVTGGSSNYANTNFVLKATSFVTFAIDSSKTVTGDSGLLVYDGDLTPCICDLEEGECDPNCCCDSLCSASETALFFHCSDQIAWRYVNSHWCNATSFPEIIVEDYESLMCVETSNAGSRGLFFVTPSDVTTSTAFSSEASYESYFYNASSAVTIQDLAYKYSVPVQTYQDPIYGFIAIPQPLVSSECADLSAGLYLVREKQKCTRSAAVVASCSNSPVLDWNTYDTNAFPVKSTGTGTSTLSYSKEFLCATIDSNGNYVTSSCSAPTVSLSGSTCSNGPFVTQLCACMDR